MMHLRGEMSWMTVMGKMGTRMSMHLMMLFMDSLMCAVVSNSMTYMMSWSRDGHMVSTCRNLCGEVVMWRETS